MRAPCAGSSSALALTQRFGGGPDAWQADARADDIHFSLGGLATAPDIPWQNRPTFQQVVQMRP